jgi:hypothetical protein
MSGLRQIRSRSRQLAFGSKPLTRPTSGDGRNAGDGNAGDGNARAGSTPGDGICRGAKPPQA